MIKEFSTESFFEWGNGTVDMLHFGHCIIQVVRPKTAFVYDLKVYRNGQYQVGSYDSRDEKWKIIALVDAFKFHDTEEDKAALAKVILLRMTETSPDVWKEPSPTRFYPKEFEQVWNKP